MSRTSNSIAAFHSSVVKVPIVNAVSTGVSRTASVSHTAWCLSSTFLTRFSCCSQVRAFVLTVSCETAIDSCLRQKVPGILNRSLVSGEEKYRSHEEPHYRGRCEQTGASLFRKAMIVFFSGFVSMSYRDPFVKSFTLSLTHLADGKYVSLRQRDVFSHKVEVLSIVFWGSLKKERK